MIIKKMYARQVLDSRGNPTIEAEVITDKGGFGRAMIPSGASTGTKEAVELRDGNPKLYGGKGVLKAIKNFNTKIAPKVIGMDASKQQELDKFLIELDGSPDKRRLGANAILAASLGAAKAAASEKGVPLYRHIADVYKVKNLTMPTPMMNVINGGEHADSGIDIQEFLLMPIGAKDMATAVRYGAEVFHTLKGLLKKDGYTISVGDEGGFAPNLKTNEAAIKYIKRAIIAAGYVPGKDVAIAIDLAANSMYNEETKKYNWEGKTITGAQLIKKMVKWVEKYPELISIEDISSEFDWQTSTDFTKVIGDKIQVMGDDLFVTNKVIFQEGIDLGCCNSILIKINQIGTLSETYETIKLAKDNNYATIISHRSGETEDSALADLAVGWNTKQIKTGSLSRSERIAKYNQLIRISEVSGFKYSGKKIKE